MNCGLFRRCPHKRRRKGEYERFLPMREAALKSKPMKASSEGFLQVGFGKDAVTASADKIVEAIKKTWI